MARQYEPKDVLGDLLYLRKGAGFTDERFAARNALIGVLGGPSEHPDVLRERVESAIQSLHDGDAELLMDVFGLSVDTEGAPSLAARRDVAGKRLGIKREAVADRDALALDRLLTQLLTGWYPKSPTGIRIPESHNGFVQHAVHNKTFLRDGIHLETQRLHRLFALFDDAPYIALSAGTPEPPVVVGTDFTVKTAQVANGWSHQFWHKEPMKRGQTYDLHYRIINPNPDEKAQLVYDAIAFHEPTRFVTFEAMCVGQQPSIAWRFSGLTQHERPGEPTARSLVRPDETGVMVARFADIFGGLWCGLAWDW